jgi:hypothetical protein
LVCFDWARALVQSTDGRSNVEAVQGHRVQMTSSVRTGIFEVATIASLDHKLKNDHFADVSSHTILTYATPGVFY